MRHMLIPTDCSDNAMHAITYGLELFKYEKCVFYFSIARHDAIYGEEPTLTASNLEEISITRIKS